MFKTLGFISLLSFLFQQALAVFPCVESDQISCDPNNVHFYLYPNSNDLTDYEEILYGDSAALESSRFKAGKPVILLTHGFIQNFTSDMPVVVKDAYLRNGFGDTANIITVDWGQLSGSSANIDPPPVEDLASLPLYIMAVANVPVVGKRVQGFLTFLVNNKKTTNEDIHLVGQSLGAHVSGLAGMYFKQITSQPIQRITGTDPAAPLFFHLYPDGRLDATDATFVDIVHTNQFEFGWVGDLGDVDFYVNGGGPLQPTCSPLDLSNPFCAHNLAPHYYAQSISNPSLRGECRLLNCLFAGNEEVTFGEHCPQTSSGPYYINLDPTNN